MLSREPRDVELFSGRLDADRLRRLLTALVPLRAVDHVWLCGPFGMIADARAVLEELGVAAGHACTSSCSTSTSRRPSCTVPRPVVEGETSDVTVVLDGRQHDRADAARPDASSTRAQATRTDLPFACKGGVCGTCRAQVTDGEVDMRRNYALETTEVERGFVLTCQTHPVSDAVTVDFDA